MKKRILAGLMAFMMMLSVVPATEVSAASVSGNGLGTVSGPNLEEANTPAPIADDVIDTEEELKDAFAKATAGATITLGGDITVKEMIVMRGGKNVTIEGAGKTITFNNTKYGFGVVESTLTLGEGLNIVANGQTCPLYVQNGTAITSANISTENGNGYSPIMINGGHSAMVTINGGDIVACDARVPAIYWPGQGTLTVNGGTITGATAIYLKSGNLKITDGVLVGNGNKADYEYVVSGNKPTGAAVVVENVGIDDYEAVGNVSITGGTFTSDNASAIESYTAGNAGVNAVTGFITGGLFGSDPAAYVADGCSSVSAGNGMFMVCGHPESAVEHYDECETSCTYSGMKEHWWCTNCGLAFLDKDLTQNVSEQALEIPTTAHNFVNGECTYGCGTKVIVAEDAEIEVKIKAADVQSNVSATIVNEEEKAVADAISNKIMADPAGLVDSVVSVGEECAEDEALAKEAKECFPNSKEEDIEIVVKPYLQTTITAVDTDASDDQAVVSLEMKLLYNVVATDGNKETPLEEGVEAKTAKPMMISFALPSDVIDGQALKAAGKVLYIEHPKADGSVYYHEAFIDENVYEEEIDGERFSYDVIGFYNDKGFSEFKLMVGSEVPADKVVSTSAPAPAPSIAMYEKTGEYIPAEVITDENLFEEAKDFLKSLIGDSRKKFKLVLAADLTAELDRATKIKILVEGVDADDAVIILHKGEDGWEVIPSEVGEDYVVGKFTELSPVLVYVDHNGARDAAQAAAKAPVAGTTTPAPTGDSANIVGLSLTMLACAAAIVLFSRRRVNK